MVEQKRGIRAFWAWLWDKAIEHWPEAISTFFLGGGMTYLAAVTDWMKPWGQIGWAAIGFLSMFVVISCYAIYWWARRNKAATTFTEKIFQSTTINPLSDIFSKQRIKLSDFFNPFYEPVETAKFQDCELLGPSNIFPVGSTFLKSGFLGCQVVIFAQDTTLIGVTAFKNCIFERCKFFQVTFYMTKDQYINLKKQAGTQIQGMPIISDGNAGNL
jgi:hypothetical protein